MITRASRISILHYYLFFRAAKEELSQLFRYNAGNFYINDKSTGSVVGQQPFGGARLSGKPQKYACI